LNGGTILASNSELNDTVRRILQDAVRSVRKR
jgi:hypothetical protein